MNSQTQSSEIHNCFTSTSDLKIGNTILLPHSGKTFRIDNITFDGYVDMTPINQNNHTSEQEWNEILFCVKLINFEIIS